MPAADGAAPARGGLAEPLGEILETDQIATKDAFGDAGYGPEGARQVPASEFDEQADLRTVLGQSPEPDLTAGRSPRPRVRQTTWESGACSRISTVNSWRSGPAPTTQTLTEHVC